MTTTAHDTTLVLGGTGKTGRRVADRLARSAASPVRARLPLGHAAVRLGRPLDLGRRRSRRDRRLPLLLPRPRRPRRGRRRSPRSRETRRSSSGVRRLVLLSGRGEPEAQQAEQAVQALGADGPSSAAAGSRQNFSESFLLDGILAGTLALPVGDVREPFVDVEDIADVAVAALTEDGHAGRLYELTGPRAAVASPRPPPRSAGRRPRDRASSACRSTPTPPSCASTTSPRT